ncbi:MAG: hypothetical protein ABEN55_04035 [Bradymonadaceae bacterium]
MSEPLNILQCVQNYLDEHGAPDGGSYREQARQLLDDVDWSAAVHTVADYRT